MQTEIQDPKERLEFLENARKQLEAEITSTRGELATVGSIDWWNARGITDEVRPLIDQIANLQDEIIRLKEAQESERIANGEGSQQAASLLEQSRKETQDLKAELLQLSIKLKPATVKSIKVDDQIICIHCGKGGAEDEHEEGCLDKVLDEVHSELERLSR